MCCGWVLVVSCLRHHPTMTYKSPTQQQQRRRPNNFSTVKCQNKTLALSPRAAHAQIELKSGETRVDSCHISQFRVELRWRRLVCRRCRLFRLLLLLCGPSEIRKRKRWLFSKLNKYPKCDIKYSDCKSKRI